MSAPPRRPRWKRKSAWAALALWLGVVYPLSRGPAAYTVARGQLPAAFVQALYAPLELMLPRFGPPTKTLVFLGGPHFVSSRPQVRGTQWFYSYVDWWSDLGLRHAEAVAPE